MNVNGYRLSSQAAAAERARQVASAGNVVPLRTAARPREQREVTFADVYGFDRDTWLAGIGIVDTMSAAQISVTPDSAMTVPAFAASVNVLSGALASLPLPVYRRKRDKSRERDRGRVAQLLNGAVNDELTSFAWRRQLFNAKLTTGRGLSYIERDSSGRVLSLWPMDPARTTVRREGFRTLYDYRDGSRSQTYRADEVIDLPFMIKGDGYSSRSPLAIGKDAIGLAIALTQYGSRFFANGGVPPFAIEGQFVTPKGMQHAADDLAAAVKKAAAQGRQALVLPEGHKIVPIGGDPEKAQMVELHKFCIEQIARIFSIPPTFLQDLTHGTFSNTEQQDLHFVKHTLMQHVRQFEQELNLKLFGASSAVYAEMNVDGLLRGDFKARMEGWSKAIQSGLAKPAEGREAENWSFAPGSDRLFVQGAMVPIDQAGQGSGPGGAHGNGNPPGDLKDE